jgi:hypothetical protein
MSPAERELAVRRFNADAQEHHCGIAPEAVYSDWNPPPPTVPNRDADHARGLDRSVSHC